MLMDGWKTGSLYCAMPEAGMTKSNTRVVVNVDRRTYGWKMGSLYCAMPEAGVTKSKEFLHFCTAKAPNIFWHKMVVFVCIIHLKL